MEVTTFDEVFHVFLNSIQDYKIARLFRDDLRLAQDLIDTFFVRALPGFYNCTKDIVNLDEVNHAFRCKLDLREINIIVLHMEIAWMERVVNDITQMNLKITDSDFKTYSEEKNLKEKSAYLNGLREIVSQRMVEYGLYTTPFKEWASGNYGV